MLTINILHLENTLCISCYCCMQRCTASAVLGIWVSTCIQQYFSCICPSISGCQVKRGFTCQQMANLYTKKKGRLMLYIIFFLEPKQKIKILDWNDTTSMYIEKQTLAHGLLCVSPNPPYIYCLKWESKSLCVCGGWGYWVWKISKWDTKIQINDGKKQIEKKEQLTRPICLCVDCSPLHEETGYDINGSVVTVTSFSRPRCWPTLIFTAKLQASSTERSQHERS